MFIGGILQPPLDFHYNCRSICLIPFSPSVQRNVSDFSHTLLIYTTELVKVQFSQYWSLAEVYRPSRSLSLSHTHPCMCVCMCACVRTLLLQVNLVLTAANSFHMWADPCFKLRTSRTDIYTHRACCVISVDRCCQLEVRKNKRSYCVVNWVSEQLCACRTAIAHWQAKRRSCWIPPQHHGTGIQPCLCYSAPNTTIHYAERYRLSCAIRWVQSISRRDNLIIELTGEQILYIALLFIKQDCGRAWNLFV